MRLDEGLLRDAKAEASRRGETVTALIERGLRLVLAGGRARARRARITCHRSHEPWAGPILAWTSTTRARSSTGSTDVRDSARRQRPLYAFRRDAERHDDYRSWLDTLVNGEAAYGLSPQVLASVTRIATHRRIYVHPSTCPRRWRSAKRFFSPNTAPSCSRAPAIGTSSQISARKSRATGNLVQDAWLAALAIESGCEWVTTDRDYARFPGLRWREPF